MHPWLHEIDFCRAIEWLIDRDDMAGPVNLASPQPVTNREMMQIVRRAARVTIGLPATRWMLEIGAALLRTETELIIKSRRVVPSRLTAAGFKFVFPELYSAIQDLERQRPELSPQRCQETVLVNSK